MVKRGLFLAPSPFNLYRCWYYFLTVKKKTWKEAKCCGLFFSIARPHPSMSTDPRCVILLCAGHFGLTLTQVPVVAMGGVMDLLGHFGLYWVNELVKGTTVKLDFEVFLRECTCALLYFFLHVIGRKCHVIKTYTAKGHDESIHLLRVRVFY